MSVPARAKIVDIAHDAMLVHDFEGVLSLWNRGAERLYGWSREEALGRTVDELLGTRFPGSREEALGAVRRSGEWRGELVQTNREGNEIRVDSRWSLQYDDNGNVIGCLQSNRDVTPALQREPGVKGGEIDFRMLVEHNPHGIFVADAEGHYLDVNPAGEKMLGYTRSEILKLSIPDIVVPDDVPKVAPELMRLGGGGVVRSDWQFRRKDGSVFPGEVLGCQLPDGRLQAIVSDLTERKQAEEALRQTSDQLRSLLQISQKLTSKLDLHVLFGAAASCLRGSVVFDVAAIVLPDALGMMRVRVLDSPLLNRSMGEEAVMPSERELHAQVPRDGHVRVLFQEELRLISSRFLQQLYMAGVRSACCTLLCLGPGPTGSLWLGSTRENAFAAVDLDWIRQIATMLSIALDNSRVYLEIAELRNKLAEEKQILEQDIESEFGVDEIIGSSSVLKYALDQSRLVADTNASVLITGETGTGKELIARIIHRTSRRNGHSFVKLNCASIPSGLLESELFGHEKGAFTHATSRKQGRLELADQGTLFLDEIGEMPLEVQPKLLRVLQDHEFERLGSNHTIHVDVRLIAATNRDLRASVASGEFRSDLFYRVNVFPIHLPPLRERREDIPGLVTHFVAKHARRMQREIASIPERTLEALMRWHWPGNIRELENFLERSVILSPLGILNAPLAELAMAVDLRVEDGLEQVQRVAIIEALRKSNGVIAGRNGAAIKLGLKRTTLQSKLSRMGIDPSEYDSGNAEN